MKRNKGQSPIQYATVILVIVALVGAWMAYFGGGGGGGGETVKYEEKEIAWENLPEMTMTYGLKDPAMNGIFTWRGATAFKDYVEKASHGKITVELHPGGELGGGKELMEMVQKGTIDGCMNALATLMSEYPDFTVSHVPYAYPSRAIAEKAWDIHGEFGEAITEDFREEIGVRIIGITCFGARSFTANQKLDSPSDFEGKKFRVMPSPAMMKLTNKLGGSPTEMEMNEVYQALKTGVIDGQENPAWVIDWASLYEVNNWLTLDKHVYGLCAWTVNEEWFQSLPRIYQKIILHGGTVYDRAASNQVTAALDWGLEHVKEKGMNVYHLSSEEKMAYKEEVTAPVAQYIKNEVINDPKWLSMMIEARNDAMVKLNYVNNNEAAMETLPSAVQDLVE